MIWFSAEKGPHQRRKKRLHSLPEHGGFLVLNVGFQNPLLHTHWSTEVAPMATVVRPAGQVLHLSLNPVHIGIPTSRNVPIGHASSPVSICQNSSCFWLVWACVNQSFRFWLQAENFPPSSAFILSLELVLYHISSPSDPNLLNVSNSCVGLGTGQLGLLGCRYRA